MPLGAARIALLAKTQVVAAAEVIRKKLGIQAIGDAQIDTAESKFGGSSALFDGTGDILRLPSFLFTGDFTVEGWVNPDNVSGISHFFSNRLSNFSNGEMDIGIWNGTSGGTRTAALLVEVREANANYDYFFSANNAFSIGTWTHWAVVRNSGTFTIYINGTASGGTMSGFTDTIGVDGQNWDIAHTSLNPYDGHMDEFRISNTARYTSGFTPSTTPFVNDDNTLLLLHMDGTDGSTYFEDDNGVGRSAVGITSANGAVIDTAVSNFGGSSGDFYVNSNNALQVGGSTTPFDLAPSASDEWTIECWIYFENSPSDFDSIIANAWPLGTRSWNLRLGRASPEGTGDQLEFVYRDNTNTQYLDLQDPSTISANTWTHIAVSSDGTNHRMFVGGSLVDTATARALQTGSSECLIGNAGGLGFPFQGHIDEVRISDVCRYTTSFTAPTAPFVNDSNTLLLLHMDGTDASTLFLDDNGATRSRKAIQAIGGAQIDTAQSEYGGSSALFDGTDDYLTGTPAASTDYDLSTNWTIEFWMRATLQGGEYPAVFYYGNQGTSKGWAVELGPSGNLTWISSNDGSSGMTVRMNTATGIITTNTWHHCAISVEGTSGAIFVDGTRRATGVVDPVAGDSSSVLRIGGGQGGLSGGNFGSNTSIVWLTGHLDEIRISNTARYSVSETSVTAPTEPFQNDANTLFLLHCDGTDGDTDFVDDNGKESA